jgi:hypothetical protein
MSVKVTRDNVPAVLKSIQDMVGTQLLIGVPAADPERRGDEAINNASIGYIQETGSPANNLPARPFLVPGVAAVQGPALAMLKKGAKDALDGDPRAAGRALNAVGLMAQSSVRNTINAGVDPPLAPATLAARRRRGRTGTTPLIDTGQLRNAITYVLRGKK